MLHLINGSRAAKSAVLLSVSCAVLLAVSCVSVDAAQSQPGHKDTTMPSGAVSGDLSIPAGPISIPQNAGT